MDGLHSSAGPELAERMGRAAASITRSTLQPTQTTSAKTQLKRSTKYAGYLRTFFPFDGLAWGDPELDVATFMAEMDFEDWETAPVAAINAHFLAGYEAVAGPLDERLLHAYRTHKRLSKALRNAYAVRTDNDMRVQRALGQALICAL